MYFGEHTNTSLLSIPGMEIAGSGYACFSFSQQCQSCAQSGYTNTYATLKVMGVLVTHHLCQNLKFAFFHFRSFGSVQWYLFVVSICISLMINKVEYSFMYLLAIQTFFVKVFPSLLPIFSPYRVSVCLHYFRSRIPLSSAFLKLCSVLQNYLSLFFPMF